MSPEDLAAIRSKQEVHGLKIESIEKTIENVFPPLMDKLTVLTERLHENSEAITLHIEKSGIQDEAAKAAFERIRIQQEKLDTIQTKDRENFQKLKDEIIENRPIIRMVKGLGTKLVGLAIIVLGSAVAIIMAQ